MQLTSLVETISMAMEGYILGIITLPKNLQYMENLAFFLSGIAHLVFFQI